MFVFRKTGLTGYDMVNWFVADKTEKYPQFWNKYDNELKNRKCRERKRRQN